MGSKQVKEAGLETAGDQTRGYPEQFTILDVDISRAALLKLYADKPTEQAVIRAVKQERRGKRLAPPAFVESCESGVTDPIQYIKLKPDCNGKIWLIVDKGNNRCMALRRVNERRAVHGHPPFMLKGIQASRAGSGDAAGLFALEQSSLSNTRVRVLPSQNAETAAKFAGHGLPPHAIIRYLQDVSTEVEVLDLLALDACSEAVKDAVDDGRVKVGKAHALAKMSEEAQAAWLAARLAPKAARVKPPADAPRPLRAPRVAAMAERLTVLSGAKVNGSAPREAIAALLFAATGDIKALDGFPVLREAWLYVSEGGGEAK